MIKNIIIAATLTSLSLLNYMGEVRAAESMQCDNNLYNCSFAYAYYRDEYDSYKAMYNKYSIAFKAWKTKVDDINQKYAQKYQLVDGVFPSDLIVVCSYETLSSPPFTTNPHLRGRGEVSAAFVKPDCMLRWYNNNSGMKKPLAPELGYKSKSEVQQEQAFADKMKAQGKKYVCTEAYCEWQ